MVLMACKTQKSLNTYGPTRAHAIDTLWLHSSNVCTCDGWNLIVGHPDVQYIGMRAQRAGDDWMKRRDTIRISRQDDAKEVTKFAAWAAANYWFVAGKHGKPGYWMRKLSPMAEHLSNERLYKYYIKLNSKW